jgi:hypothetical protein
MPAPKRSTALGKVESKDKAGLEEERGIDEIWEVLGYDAKDYLSL